MDWAETLFVRCYDEISAGLRARDDYERLKTAAALRQMLVDAAPLAFQANKKHRLKIRFRLNSVPSLTEMKSRADLSFHAHGLDPNRFQFPGGTINVKLDEFIKQPIIEWSDGEATIADVIKFAANKIGGIHLDATRDEHETRIEEALSKFSSGGLIHPLAIALETVATISLAALKPLRDTIVRIPSSLPLMAWYKREPNSAILFQGHGQFLETNFKKPITHGVSWNCVLRIMPQAERGNRAIYEIGNRNGDPPKLSIMFDGESLSASAELAPTKSLSVRAPQFQKTPFFDRISYIAVDFFDFESKTDLALYINERPIAADTAEGDSRWGSFSRHTIGSQLDGGLSSTFQLHELIIAARCPSRQERSRLAEYFWLQWHG